jgi:hypothetical protein
VPRSGHDSKEKDCQGDLENKDGEGIHLFHNEKILEMLSYGSELSL